jgi:hypothetical protein
MMIHCVNFCVDELLWMLAWGWYQLAVGIVLTWLAYMFLGKIRMLPAFILALGAYGFSIFVYFACVAGLFVHYFQLSFVAGKMPHVYSPLYASLLLGVIYSALQLFFYCIINYWRTFSVMYFFVLSLVCNTVAALIASSFIKITF